MPSSEPKRPAGLAAALGLVAVLVAGISLIDVLVEPPYRQAAMRLVAAAVLGLAVVRVRALVRASIDRPSTWGVDRAGEPAAVPPSLGTRFPQLHDEIRFSTKSQRYFDHVLWPRLRALARAGTEPADGLAKPPGRRLGRGPSLEALRELIAALERRR